MMYVKLYSEIRRQNNGYIFVTGSFYGAIWGNREACIKGVYAVLYVPLNAHSA